MKEPQKGQLVFFIYKREFLAGKVLEKKGERYRIMTYMSGKRYFSLKRNHFSLSYDSMLQAFRQKFPGQTPDVDDFIDLVKYLRSGA